MNSEKIGNINKISAGSDKLDVDAPLSIHSVGKVFTGILTLIMIREGILTTNDLQTNIFDQLDESVKNKLPPAAMEHLKTVTLHEAMTHMAGLGNHKSNANYLERYGKTISDAITINRNIFCDPLRNENLLSQNLEAMKDDVKLETTNSTVLIAKEIGITDVNINKMAKDDIALQPTKAKKAAQEFAQTNEKKRVATTDDSNIAYGKRPGK